MRVNGSIRVLRISSRFFCPHPILSDNKLLEYVRLYRPIGGLQLQAYSLTKALSSMGVHQTVLSSRPPWASAAEKIGNTEIFRSGFDVAIPRQLYEIPAAIKMLSLTSDPYDIVHCHVGEDVAVLPMSIIASIRSQAPLVLSLHSSWNYTFSSANKGYKWVKGILGKHIESHGLKYSSSICTLTARMRQILINSGVDANKVHYIPFGIDLPFYSKHMCNHFSTLEHKLERQLVKVVYVGRLSYQKGVSTLLKAVEMLKNRGHRIKLTICGDGDQREALNSLCKKYGIQDIVVFTGFVAPDMIPNLLGENHIFVMPSNYEELGMAVIEAMAMKKVIVASDTGGIRELIKHDTRVWTKLS